MDRLDPNSTGLLVFDMLECYRERIPAAVVARTRDLIRMCRNYGIAVLYARADHRQDSSDLNRTLTDTDGSGQPWEAEGQHFEWRHPPETMVVLSELSPALGDYEIAKHRWNAFFQTPLELSLRTRGIDTLMIVGGSTHVGIASTVYSARDMDFQVIVVRDCLTGFEAQRSFFVENVFPRMCRVRSVEKISEMLKNG